jgi:ParB family chromosome partitioning protein
LETDEEIGVAEARQLAKDIQTAKEHSLREIGLSLALLKSSGMSQKEIALESALSESKVTRALQAASVPSDMLSRFPDQNELTYPDYKILMEISQELASKEIAFDGLFEQVDQAKRHLSDDLPSDDYKQALMKTYTSLSKKLVAKPAKTKPQVTKLKEFDDKNVYARKKVLGGSFKYEFQRLPAELQQKIDLAISAELKQFYQD